MDVTRLDFNENLVIRSEGDWQGFRSNAAAKEPETVEWIKGFSPESNFWDVGASVGPYSLIAASLGHKVIAFEPFAPSYGHLVQNAWINRLPITSLPVAIGTQGGFQSLRASDIQAGAASHGKGDFPQAVIVMAADDLADQVEVPRYVKVDVDGAELDVIESGRALWPLIDSMLIECSDKTAGDVEMVLSGCGLERKDRWERSGGMFNYLYERAQ